jgi:hypothetical protein
MNEAVDAVLLTKLDAALGGDRVAVVVAPPQR